NLVGICSNPNPDQKFVAIQSQLVSLEAVLVRDIRNPIADALSTVKAAVNSTEALVRESDSLLIGSPLPILSRLDPAIAAIDRAGQKSWPESKINEALALLATLKLCVRSLPGSWVDQHKSEYDFVDLRLDELKGEMERLKRNDDRDKFDEAQGKLLHWREIFANTKGGGERYFSHQIDVRCGATFDAGEEKKIKLTRKNRLEDTTSAETREVITVVCSPPLSVSAGFGFSSIKERDIAFVQSTKSTTSMGQTTQTLINRFGFKNKSSFRTLPVILLNTRVWEPSSLTKWYSDFGLHLSVGAAVDFKGQLGTDAEFIVGPSVAFKRTLFVTPGLHVGRVPKLAGGFQIGDEVPSGVDAPPIEKAWKPGFALTFTFKIK
ncbi:MAG TPA: hypothetical protein VEF04_23035, partial [Blastocatellia bacterium]|nr:hypothetical protein [Blastocatellia bacterium]